MVYSLTVSPCGGKLIDKITVRETTTGHFGRDSLAQSIVAQSSIKHVRRVYPTTPISVYLFDGFVEHE